MITAGPNGATGSSDSARFPLTVRLCVEGDDLEAAILSWRHHFPEAQIVVAFYHGDIKAFAHVHAVTVKHNVQMVNIGGSPPKPGQDWRFHPPRLEPDRYEIITTTAYCLIDGHPILPHIRNGAGCFITDEDRNVLMVGLPPGGAVWTGVPDRE